MPDDFFVLFCISFIAKVSVHREIGQLMHFHVAVFAASAVREFLLQIRYEAYLMLEKVV